MSCVAELYFTRVRHTALSAIFAAYKTPKKNKYEWSQQDLIKALGFDGEDDPVTAVEGFCRAYDFEFFVEDGSKYVDLNSVGGKRLVGPTSSQKPGFNRTVERKRYGRTLAAAISGMSVEQARAAGRLKEDLGRPKPSHRSDGLFWTKADDEMHIAGGTKGKAIAQARLSPKSQQQAVFNFGSPSKLPETRSAGTVKPTNPFAGATPPVASIKTPLTFGSGRSTVKLPGSSTPSPKPPFTFGFGAPNSETPSSPSSFTKSSFTFGAGGPFSQTSSVPPASTKSPPTFGAGGTIPAKSTTLLAPPKSPFTLGNGGSTSAAPISSAQSAATMSSSILGSGDSIKQSPPPQPTFVNLPTFTNLSPKRLETKTSGVTAAEKTSSFEEHSPLIVQADSQTPQISPVTEPLGRPPDRSRPDPRVVNSQTTSSPLDFKPKSPTPEQVEAQRRKTEAEAQAKRKTRDSRTLDQLARELVLGPYGFLDQYIEYTAPRIITEIREQVRESKKNQQADQFRYAKLATRYGLKWKEIPWKKRLAAQGKSRRQRLRADKEEKERQSRGNSISATVQDFRKSMGASSSRSSAETVPQNGVASPTQAAQKLAQTVQVDAFGNSVLSIQPSSPQRQRTGPLSPQGHRRTESTPSRSIRLAGLHSVRQNRLNSSSRLRNSFLPGDPFDESASSAASSVRADTTRSTYFKLKSMGLETPPVTKRRRSDTGGSLMSRPDKRVTTSISPVQALMSQENSKEKPEQSHMPKTAVTTEEDEEIFAQIRQVRDAMSDSMTFFQEERKKDEDFRRSQSSTGSADTPPASDKRPTAIRDWKAIAEERIAKALRASTVSTTTSHEKAREFPPAYRNRISKFLPRERYADKLMAQRQDIGDRPKYVPNRFRKVERMQQEAEEEVPSRSPIPETVTQDAQPTQATTPQPRSRIEHGIPTLGTHQERQRQRSQHDAAGLQSHSQPGMWGSIDPALFIGQNTFLFDSPSVPVPSRLPSEEPMREIPATTTIDVSTFLESPSSLPQQAIQPAQPRRPATPPSKETAPPIKEATPSAEEVAPSKSGERVLSTESSFYNGVTGPSTISQWPLDLSSSSFGANTVTDNTFGKAMTDANKTVTDMLASSFGQSSKTIAEAEAALNSKPQTSASTSSFGLFGQTSSNANSSFAGFGQLSNSKPSVGFSFGRSTSKVPSQPQIERGGQRQLQLVRKSPEVPAVTNASPSREAKQPPSQAKSVPYQVIELANLDHEDRDTGDSTEFDSSRPQSREHAAPARTLAKPSPPSLKRHYSEAENGQPRKAQRIVSANRFDLLADLGDESEVESLISQPREPSQDPSETFDTAPQDQQNHEHEHQHEHGYQHRRTSIELTAVDAQKYLEREASEGDEAPGFGENMDALDAFNVSHAARRNTSSASQSGFEYEDDFDQEGPFREDDSEAASPSSKAFARYHADQLEEYGDEEEEELTPKHSNTVRNRHYFSQDAQRQAQMGLDDGLEYEDEDEVGDLEANDGLGYSEDEGLDGSVGDEDGFEEDGSLADDDDESEEEDFEDEDEQPETDSSRTSPSAKKPESGSLNSKSQRGQSQQPSQLINGKGGTSADDAIEL